MAEIVTNVSTGKPANGGAIYRAPLGSELPTDVVSPLSEDFTCLGFVSEDGLTNSNSPESDTIKAWGGKIVYTTQNEKPDTFAFKLIEVLNPDVHESVYGADNVSGTLETGIEIKATSDEAEESSYIVEMMMRNGVLKRIVIPDAKISEVGDIVYKDVEVAGYEVTLTALPDENRVTHYEYIKSPEESE